MASARLDERESRETFGPDDSVSVFIEPCHAKRERVLIKNGKLVSYRAEQVSRWSKGPLDFVKTAETVHR
jgi:hypothetical protein